MGWWAGTDRYADRLFLNPRSLARPSVADLGKQMLEPHRKDRRLFNEARPEFDAIYSQNVLYYAVFHVMPLMAILTGVTRSSIVVCIVLYIVRILFITAGYHCYFAHRSFKTSRIFQLILAIGAQTSGQGGAMKWAAAHHYHHTHADGGNDLHSPHRGFWYAHIGWLFTKRYEYLIPPYPKYLTKFPELVWLNRYFYVPTIVLAVVVWAFLGWSGLFIGYGLSTLLTFHATFSVNSLCHLFGTRTFETPDESRNNWFVSLIMLGGGWHNNHHHSPRSARQGIRWWEIDITYYSLRMLQYLHIIWDVYDPTSVRAQIRSQKLSR